MKKIKKSVSFPSIYFGFLSAFAMMMAFFIFKNIINIIPKISKVYANILAIIIYTSFLISSHYYSEYDKDLRKSLIISSIILWVIYFITIGLIYII